MNILKGFKKTFTFDGCQIYWFFVLLCGVYLLISGVNTPLYIFPVFVALISAGLVIHQVEYQWSSFVTVITIGHVVAYPLGVVVVLSLSAPSLAIESDLWITTPDALFGMALAMMGVFLGVFSVHKLYGKPKFVLRKWAKARKLTPVWLNVCLMLFVIPIIIIYIKANIYFHKDVSSAGLYDVNNSVNLGFLGYFIYISYAGIILQIRRFVITKSNIDRNYAFFCVSVPFLALMPSGSRANTLIILVIALLYFLDRGNESRLKIKVLVGALFIFVFFTVAIDIYRLSSSFFMDTSIINQGIDIIRSVFSNTDVYGIEKNNELGRAIVGRRISDLYSVGYLMQLIPSSFYYRGGENIFEYLFYIFPTSLRPDGIVNYNNASILMMNRYSFRTDIGGSSPMMLVGDLYSRAGWFGIFLGMFCIGFLLRRLDFWIDKGSVSGAVLWAMLIYGMINMYTYSLVQVYVLLTRQLIIFLVIIYALNLFIKIGRVNNPR